MIRIVSKGATTELGACRAEVRSWSQLIGFLCRVGTFDPALFTAPGNEIRANNAANVQARGVDGINIPSLESDIHP